LECPKYQERKQKEVKKEKTKKNREEKKGTPPKPAKEALYHQKEKRNRGCSRVKTMITTKQQRKETKEPNAVTPAFWFA